MKQHPERPQRRSKRLKNYDYSQRGAYFITICTKYREIFFEEFPKLKYVVHVYWNELGIRFQEIELDEFVLMPNHLHGIVFIMSKNVGAIHELPLQARRSMLLPKAIGYFKMNTAKRINLALKRTGQPFWQRNYYEHIIRTEGELNRIREYIQNNPLKWHLDRENPESSNFNLHHDIYWKDVFSRGNS